MAKKLKLGVIGASNHFLKRCRIPLQNSDLIEIYAIASRDELKAKSIAEKYNIPKYFGDYDALLNDAAVDFVYIPLPNHLHLEWIKKAADKNKHILCEKPITLNATEALAAASYCKEKGVKIMEAFMYRFHPQWQYVKQLADSGEMGDLKSIHTFFGYNNTQKNNIRNIFEYGGGAIYDIGCYAISVPRFLLNREPDRVISLVKRDDDFKTDVLSSAILDFNDARALFTVSTQINPYQRVQLFFAAGRIEIDIPFNTFQDVAVSVYATNYIGTREIKFGPADQYLLMFDAFAKAIINNTAVPTPVEDAIANMKVIDAVFKSELSGNWEKV
jgi:predicted dehydrogenase